MDKVKSNTRPPVRVTKLVYRHPGVQPHIMAQDDRCRTSGAYDAALTFLQLVLTISFSQDPILFTGTIASNIAYGTPDATMEQIEAAAREANCEFVWGMPHGFHTESTSAQYPMPLCPTVY